MVGETNATDVLIVGAGPVGLALAVDLGQRSVRCVVVEQSDRVGLKPRAKLTNVRSRELLRRWGIAEDRLPPGSVVLFREPTAWERHKRAIVGGAAALLAQSLLIAGLLVNRFQRRRAERSLVTLRRHEAVGAHTLEYLNRLSDALFVMARWENHRRGVPDVLWDSRA